MKPRQSISAAGDVDLGYASEHSLVSVWVVRINANGATFSIQPKGYQKGNGGTKAANWHYCGYKTHVSDTLVNPGVTPITAEGTYIIVADGAFVWLEFDSCSGGTVTIDAEPLEG